MSNKQPAQSKEKEALSSGGGIHSRIADIEREIARTQKNKATNAHLCLLRARLAQLRTQVIEGGKKGPKGEGFDVVKQGHASVAMIGFPSVGKSTTLSTLTTTQSEAAAYAFTTLTCKPGVLMLNDAKVQLLDLPGIIEGAAKGKGRGRQVIAVARSSDMILMMVEAEKAEQQVKLLTKELEDVGIRLNKKKPNISIVRKPTGGVQVNSTVKLTEMNEDLCRRVCGSYKLHNAQILFREDCSVEDFIDVIEGNRMYIPCVYVANKIDTISLDEVCRLAHKGYVVTSIQQKWNIDYLRECMWDALSIMRVYTKPRGQRPSFVEPLIVPRGATVERVCKALHKSLAANFKYALVWGTSVKHPAMRVGITHVLQDEDVLQIMTQ